MKKFITIQLIILAMLFGCTPDANVISPENTPSTKQLKLIELPIPQGLSLETIYTEYKYINGSNGGWFSEDFSYQSSTGTVYLSSTLNFPANSFSGTVNISQSFNTQTASLEFGPSMVFNVPVRYTLTISGLDLTGVNSNTLSFVYVAPDGSITGVQYDYISMDAATGTLKVKNALLNHFSRYGFVN